jgi:hypothetical protein
MGDLIFAKLTIYPELGALLRQKPNNSSGAMLRAPAVNNFYRDFLGAYPLFSSLVTPYIVL